MDIQQLLKLGQPNIAAIKNACKNAHYELINALANFPQPVEWIKEGDSELLGGKYYWNEIGLIEALMNECFTVWKTNIISNHIHQDKAMFCSTTIVSVNYGVGTCTGIATTFAPSIKHLSLATPLSKSEAKKNAIKEIGEFFGRQLNRMDNSLPIIQISKEGNEVDIEFEAMKTKLSDPKLSKADAELIQTASIFKYHPELKQIVNSKK